MIGNAVTLSEIELKEQSSVPNWRKIIDHGLRYRLEEVQEAAATAYATISKREDLSKDIQKSVLISISFFEGLNTALGSSKTSNPVCPLFNKVFLAFSVSSTTTDVQGALTLL